MGDKQELVADLKTTYADWENLLSRMSEEEITTPRFMNNWSIKEVVAHLRAWQQISIARLEAALQGKEPEYPAWLMGSDPFQAEEQTDKFNAWVYEANHSMPWKIVYQEWSDGFRRFVALADQIPSDALFNSGQYPWLRGYPLSAVLEGSRDHHQEHFEVIAGIQ